MNSTQTAGETLTINGVTYNVVQRTTADSAAAQGLDNLAAHLRDTNRQELGLQRPKGRVVYMAVQYSHPVYGLSYSDPISLGGSRR